MFCISVEIHCGCFCLTSFWVLSVLLSTVQLLEKALEECGNDLDAAITRLHGLHVRYAEGNLVTASEADGEMDGGMYKHYVSIS